MNRDRGCIAPVRSDMVLVSGDLVHNTGTSLQKQRMLFSQTTANCVALNRLFAAR